MGGNWGRRWRRPVALLFVVSSALGACNDGGGPSDRSSGSTTALPEDRPEADEFEPSLSGTTAGIGWTVMRADGVTSVCVQVLATPQPGVTPQADYPSTLNPSDASCVRRARLANERTALINPTTYYALSPSVDGIWGVADQTVTRLRFRWSTRTLDVTPRDGIFFVDSAPSERDYEVSVYRDGEPVLDCAPFQPLQELTVYCQ